jgi:hypothetical protein
MEMNWSRWFRCESSFGLLLVPNQPGVFALAEEIVSAPNGRRMLAVFDVDETEDLSLGMSRLFALGSRWREKLQEGRCFLRYAVAPSTADRRAAAGALRRWLDSRREMASQIFDPAVAPVAVAAEIEEIKTVAERAVDRVTRARELAKAAGA